MLRTALAMLALLAPLPSRAHDFWIQPERFRVKPGEPVKALFRVGTAKEPEPWVIKRERIVSLVSIGPGGISDQQASVTPGPDGYALPRFIKAGPHVLAFETTAAESDLQAAQFNEYLEHEGLTPAIEARTREGKSGANGRELYARRAKALVQAGSGTGKEATMRLGHTLEIVPLKNPYALKGNEPLTIELWFEGRPLPGATIGLERLDDPSFAEVKRKTDAQGRAMLTFPKRGSWKIATVWTRPIAGNPKADFDTLFASLTFGY